MPHKTIPTFWRGTNIFDFNEAQEERFQKAITITLRLLDELEIWTREDIEKVKGDHDEFEEGYPKMRLSHLYDVVRCMADILQNKQRSTTIGFKSPEFQHNSQKFDLIMEEMAKDETKRWDSWRKVQGKLGRIERLNLFDNRTGDPLPC